MPVCRKPFLHNALLTWPALAYPLLLCYNTVGTRESKKKIKNGGTMRKVIGMVVVALLLVGMTGATIRTAQAQGPGPIGREAGEHPNIARAIEALEVAIADMERAPHDFGGHKAKAIESSQRAIRDLKIALTYRSREDNRYRQPERY